MTSTAPEISPRNVETVIEPLNAKPSASRVGINAAAMAADAKAFDSAFAKIVQTAESFGGHRVTVPLLFSRVKLERAGLIKFSTSKRSSRTF